MVDSLKIAEALQGTRFTEQQAKALAQTFMVVSEEPRSDLITVDHLDRALAQLELRLTTLVTTQINHLAYQLIT